MVIDPSNPSLNKASGATTGSTKPKPAASPEAPAAGKPAAKAAGDNVSLSSQAQTLGRLEQAMQKSPEVDEAKVSAIKQAIAEGRYQINSDRIAERMLAQDGL